MNNDLISRQAAIQIVANTIYDIFDMVEDDEEAPRSYMVRKLLKLNKDIRTRIKDLPNATSTLYGYNIDHLKLIAEMLMKEDLPPERVREALTDISRILSVVRSEYTDALRRAVIENE